MNKLEISGCWHILRGNLQRQWATLTGDELHYVEGRQEERLGRMQRRTGKSRLAVTRAVKEAVYSFCCE